METPNFRAVAEALTPAQRAVWEVMREMADDAGIIEQMGSEIARRAGISRGGLKAVQDALARKGFLIRLVGGASSNGKEARCWLIGHAIDADEDPDGLAAILAAAAGRYALPAGMAQSASSVARPPRP